MCFLAHTFLLIGKSFKMVRFHIRAQFQASLEKTGALASWAPRFPMATVRSWAAVAVSKGPMFPTSPQSPLLPVAPMTLKPNASCNLSLNLGIFFPAKRMVFCTHNTVRIANQTWENKVIFLMPAHFVHEIVPCIWVCDAWFRVLNHSFNKRPSRPWR